MSREPKNKQYVLIRTEVHTIHTEAPNRKAAWSILSASLGQPKRWLRKSSKYTVRLVKD